MAYHAIGIFHLSLPDSFVVSTPIYMVSTAYNQVKHIEHIHACNKLRVTSLVHKTIYTE